MDKSTNSPRKHLLNVDFGTGKKNKNMEVLDFITKNNVPTSIAKQIVLSEMYDELYGIHNHSDLSKPLSLVAIHEMEEYEPQSLEYRTMKDFANNELGKHFNLSYLEYISLPVSVHESMIKVATELNKRTSKTISEFKDQFDNI